MPSPIGHGLAALALAELTRELRADPPAAPGQPGHIRTRRENLVFFGALIFAANAPDLDFIPGLLVGNPGQFHHKFVHSLFFAVVFAVAASPAARYAGFRSRRRFGLLMGLAVTSHLLLDMVSTDQGVRYGVPIVWPFSRESFVLPFAVFRDIKFDSVPGSFVRSVLVTSNLYAMVWEFVLMGAVLAVCRIVGLARSGRWNRDRA